MSPLPWGVCTRLHGCVFRRSSLPPPKSRGEPSRPVGNSEIRREILCKVFQQSKSFSAYRWIVKDFVDRNLREQQEGFSKRGLRAPIGDSLVRGPRSNRETVPPKTWEKCNLTVVCDIRNDTISNYILRYVDIARKIGDTQCAYVRCDTVPWKSEHSEALHWIEVQISQICGRDKCKRRHSKSPRRPPPLRVSHQVQLPQVGLGRVEEMFF